MRAGLTARRRSGLAARTREWGSQPAGGGTPLGIGLATRTKRRLALIEWGSTPVQDRGLRPALVNGQGLQLPGTGVLFDPIPPPPSSGPRVTASEAAALLPTFRPALAPPASGLDLLTAAATSAGATRLAARQTSSGLLSTPGPFNPAASVASKVVKKILELEFVELSEVSADGPAEHIPGHPPPPGKPLVTDISQWLERFSMMAAILATRYPEKAPELFAYQAAIVRAERNYETGRWVTYDRQFRREALARKDLNWSVPDPRLYNEAFTGRARAIPRCSHCLQDDHTAQRCPQNPERAWLSWMPGGAPWPLIAPGTIQAPAAAARPSPPSTGKQEVCRKYNEGRCRFTRCRYAHVCRDCGGGHPQISCPLFQAAGQRARSPQRAAPTPAGWQAPPRR